MSIHVPCLYCGHRAQEVDHIRPRSDGGGDEPSNLAPACKSCNSSKQSEDVEFFLVKHPEILVRVWLHQAGYDVLSGLAPHEPPRRRGAPDRVIHFIKGAARRLLAKELAARA
jgi:hypothetical protein